MLVIRCGSPAAAGQEAPAHQEDYSGPHGSSKSRWQQKRQKTLLLLRVMEVPGCLGPFLLRKRQEEIIKHLALQKRGSHGSQYENGCFLVCAILYEFVCLKHLVIPQTDNLTEEKVPVLPTIPLMTSATTA